MSYNEHVLTSDFVNNILMKPHGIYIFFCVIESGTAFQKKILIRAFACRHINKGIAHIF